MRKVKIAKDILNEIYFVTDIFVTSTLTTTFSYILIMISGKAKIISKYIGQALSLRYILHFLF